MFYPAYSREELIARLREKMPALRAVLPITRVVLFGSYARDQYTAASDIDLLVVYAGEIQDDAYARVRRALGIRRLEPHVYAESEYQQVEDVVQRMTQCGIPLYP
ncbi:MAG: nucleotidyltransferase domain-containing protein [Anaerolineae bacterium]|nr:nucleotidyltransferase domain-containing protein [Anaerolineae bacterium]